jgi:hypothetical protein
VWNARAAGPLPAPVPTAPKGLTGAAAVFGIMDATPPSVATLTNAGGVWAKYESDFVLYANRLWAADSVSTDANFYDRSMIYYMWWARTGNATYLDRADKLAAGDGVAYIERTNYMPQPFLLMMDGVAIHAMLTQDPRYVQAVVRTADYYGQQGGSWYKGIGDTTGIGWDNRGQARILSALLDAWYLGAPSPKGYNYGVILRDYLNRILSTQSSDGAYRFEDQCYYSKSYMTGMLNDALIRYYDTFEKDPRIPVAVKRSVDYLWNVSWDPTKQAFKYMDYTCSLSGSGGGPTPYADLNNLIVSGFGFVAKTTGDQSYMTKADAIFAGGVNGAWVAGSKQFNQEYTSSYRFLDMRF